jgi:hypothetical protein
MRGLLNVIVGLLSIGGVRSDGMPPTAEKRSDLWPSAVRLQSATMVEVQVGQVWEQVSKHERGMQLQVVRNTGRRWVLRPVGGGPSKKRGLREGLWTLSTEQINATCRLVRDVD